MFHVELRRFPHVARRFNLSAAELDALIVRPLLGGATIELDERRWPAEKTRLKIYEGSPVPPEDRGLGRGWSLVTRDGTEVTAALLEAARQRLQGGSEGFRQRLLAAAAGEGIALADVVAMAGAGLEGRRVSEALIRAEQTVWELLHGGSVVLLRGAAEVPREEWEPVLLAWESWCSGGALRMSAAV